MEIKHSTMIDWCFFTEILIVFIFIQKTVVELYNNDKKKIKTIVF